MIFVTGPHGSGKSEVGKIFASKNFITFDLGPMLRNTYQKIGYDGTFSEWIKNGEDREGVHFTDALLLKEILYHIRKESSALYQDMIIVGNRSMRGIEYLKHGIPPHRISYIIFMDASLDILHERCSQREDEIFSMQDFDLLLDSDRKMGLYDIETVADTVIKNNGSKVELREEIRRLFPLLNYHWAADQKD